MCPLCSGRYPSGIGGIGAAPATWRDSAIAPEANRLTYTTASTNVVAAISTINVTRTTRRTGDMETKPGQESCRAHVHRLRPAPGSQKARASDAFDTSITTQ